MPADPWEAAFTEMPTVHHIKHEFDENTYRMAVEIACLREKCGETVCPHYAPARQIAVESDDLPF